MAKKAARRTKRIDADPDGLTDVMFQTCTEAAKEALGRDDIVIGGQADELVVGLPLPALCLRYMAQSDVFPLGRVWQLAGEEGSCKSALMVEIMRWHMVYGGGGVLIETENKDAPLLRRSVLEYNPKWLNRLQYIPANSLEEWQSALTASTKQFRQAMDKPDGPGRRAPIMFAVDSLTSVDSQSEIDKTQAAGFASRGYATIANLISRYMRQGQAGNFRGYPFSLIGTNHLKPSTDARGLPNDTIPGGKAVPFMATFMVVMKRVEDIDRLDHGGIRVSLKLQKNSIGVSRKSIKADFLWWQERVVDAAGNPFTRQRHVWDWHDASIGFILEFETSQNRKTLFKEISKIVDLRAMRSTKMVWSKALGIKESEPVPYRVAGQMLEQRSDLLQQLYPLLGINQYAKFQPGMDYRDMEAKASEAGARETNNLYANAVEMPSVVDKTKKDFKDTTPADDDTGPDVEEMDDAGSE